MSGPTRTGPSAARNRRRTAVALLLLELVVDGGRARAQAPCNREATTSFRFGQTGGNLRPSGTAIDSRGTLRELAMGRPGRVTGHVLRAAVRALARRAWRGGFGELPTAPSEPTSNPDAARPYIELRSACGDHHVEYGPGTEPPAFRDLMSRLERLAASAGRR